MANNFDSNITRQLARVFLEKFETMRVLSKNVDTQLLEGRFNKSSGQVVDFKRPTDYISTRTADGDLSAGDPNDIITGKASGTVQDYFSVEVDYSEAAQAIEMDQEAELLAPMATRIVTDLEVDYASFMMKNTALLSGDYGVPVANWGDVANAGAVMDASGISGDMPWYYTVNPFTRTALANDQRSLGAGGTAGALISEAHKKAILSMGFAGFDEVLSATTLATQTQPAVGARAGTLTSAPDGTYLSAKDTMTQTLAVTGVGTFSGTIPAGTVVEVEGRNRLNLSTRQQIINAAGTNVVWTATVTADAVLVGGAGNLICTGPAINETAGQYNTVDTPLDTGDIINLLGLDSTLYQPNLFWHKQAFSIGSVPMEKLFSTDTIATTEDGLQIRVSKGASIRENKQIVRFDFRPAYSALNPFLAGQGFGITPA